MTWIPRARHAASVLCLAASSFGLQGTASGQAPPRVSIGTPVLNITPDMEIPVPVNINAPGEGLVRIAVTVGYSPKALKFVGFKPGGVIARVKAKVSVEEKAGEAGSDERVLAIQVDSPQPLTAGTLVTLTFRAAAELHERAEVPIRNISRTATSAGGREVRPEGADGNVTLTPLVLACFFYMH